MAGLFQVNQLGPMAIAREMLRQKAYGSSAIRFQAENPGDPLEALNSAGSVTLRILSFALLIYNS